MQYATLEQDMKTVLALIALALAGPAAFAQLASHNAVDAENLRYLRQQQDEQRNAPTLLDQSMRGFTAGQDAREQQARIEAMRAQTEALRAQTEALQEAREAQGEAIQSQPVPQYTQAARDAQQVGKRCFPGTAQLPRPVCY